MNNVLKKDVHTMRKKTEQKVMYDETQLKIIDATMTLILEKGYSGATTKNIAKLAGVNESTIFRRFDGKKKLSLLQWNYQNGIRVYQRVIFLMKEIWKRI